MRGETHRRCSPQPALLSAAHRLRLNAYRVLLTRGRDGTVIFVPPLTKLDESWAYLKACGVMELG